MSPLLSLAKTLGTSDRTLRRAVAQGLIRAERPSRRKVRIGALEHRYLEMYWDELSELREVLRTEPKVSLAVLFGSVARGDSRPASDIDLVLDVRANGSVNQIAQRLGSRVSRDVQIVPLNVAEESPALLSELLRDGRVLVDRDDVWSGLLGRRAEVDRARARERRRIEREFAAAFGHAA